MLRGRLSKQRNTSTCAFCQHRLSSRLDPLWRRRQPFSSSACLLYDNHSNNSNTPPGPRPGFPNGPGGSGIWGGGGGGGWGSSSSSGSGTAHNSNAPANSASPFLRRSDQSLDDALERRASQTRERLLQQKEEAVLNAKKQDEERKAKIIEANKQSRNRTNVDSSQLPPAFAIPKDSDGRSDSFTLRYQGGEENTASKSPVYSYFRKQKTETDPLQNPPERTKSKHAPDSRASQLQRSPPRAKQLPPGREPFTFARPSVLEFRLKPREPTRPPKLGAQKSTESARAPGSTGTEQNARSTSASTISTAKSTSPSSASSSATTTSANSPSTFPPSSPRPEANPQPIQSSETFAPPSSAGWGRMARKPSSFLSGFDEPLKPAPPTKAHSPAKQQPDTSDISNVASVKPSIVSSTVENDTDRSWGQLSRKQSFEKPNKGDFWDAMENRIRPARSSEARPKFKPEAEPNPDASATMRDTPSSSKSLGTKDWSRGYGELERQMTATRKLTEEESSKEDIPRNNGRDYDRGRDRRLERSEWEYQDYQQSRRGNRRPVRRSPYGSEDAAWDKYEANREKKRLKAERQAQRESEKSGPTPIVLPELISISALADAMKQTPDDFLYQLGEMGFEGVTLDSLMAGETAALVAQEYGFEPTIDAGDKEDLKPRPPPEDPTTLPQRPPVVTIMGHVDHGKTTLLDYLRKSSVAAQEHGGITQHIGAFSVKLSSGKPITFLDTPGHAAFLTMRQRGANVTDIVVLVVAADDSVKPQTIEALKHARAAKVPIIVAINKIDKEGAHIDHVRHDLAQAGVEIEDFGGDVQTVLTSGKTGQGMDDLEENILTLSEILDHRAETDGPAEGWVLESSLKPTGKAATVLVKRGTMRPGDIIVAGVTWARIRHLRNEAGVDIHEAPPGTPVEVLGWKDLPAAGDQVIQASNERRARTAVTYREGMKDRQKNAADYEVIADQRKALAEKRLREKAADASGKSNDVDESPTEEENGTKMINFVVKGDVHGSVEAVCASILEIGSHEVRPRILRSAAGPITESDVDHAATSKSVIINFSMSIGGGVRRKAEKEGVKILDHNVIYHLVDDVRANLSSHLTPEISTRVLGEAEILQIFPINTHGRVFKNIAGCRVRNGVVTKGALYRVLRKGDQVFDGKLETLKHIKKDVLEMRKGTECGMGFEDFQDLEVGDQIQAYEEVQTARSL
ncbi:hypothetical protein F5Y15DRAFT_417225 [Xylariaceae sp. FL0016]|nr:hypothetical protein F5Y15DRAFT_417225 [Xylariaceae sp. FL0016]